ncbi:MAG TPA: MFS transporter [Candidatus Deferrimicrobiaceae bacterium]|nr:MFS transporter [Candidatus Deferrimicrobiaceae bacterium]
MKCSLAMWRLGFFFHDMAFGLLTVFIPLYVVTFQDTSILGGPLLALGVMTSIAIFCSIPASFIWGYLCDKTRHYKAFILLSFASITVILFLMTLPFAQNILAFVILYVAMQMLHVAHESPKNVLVTEHYCRNEWERSFGFYEGLTEIGFIIGLGVGMFMFASTLSFSLLATYSFYLCSALSVVSFVLAVALIADPLMIFERRLVAIERAMDFSHRGFEGSQKLMDGLKWDGSLKRDSFLGFACAIVLFSLATSLFFTPLPVYLKEVFGGQDQYVYLAYILNSVGATVGYFLIRRQARSMDIRKQMPRFILLRSVLVFALVGVISLAVAPTILTCILLVCLGFAYAMYYIMMISLSMEIIPQGKAGLFDGMVNLGAAIGAFLGPFIANTLNYIPTFLITAVLFLAAFAVLKILR